MNGTISLGSRRRTGGRGKSSKEKMTGSTAASVWEDKVGCIGADCKDHVACMIPDGGIVVGCKVIKQHVTSRLGVFSRRGLVVGNFVESCNDRGIAAARVVQEYSGDLLDPLDASLVKKRSEIGSGQLDFLTIDRSSPEMWCMLWTCGHGVAQSGQCLGDIARHGDVNVAGAVVPEESETKVTGAGPVLG